MINYLDPLAQDARAQALLATLDAAHHHVQFIELAEPEVTNAEVDGNDSLFGILEN